MQENQTANALERLLLGPIEKEYFWIGVYRRTGQKATRVGFRGPMPPCHEFEFGKGNVGLTAKIGVRKVIADVSQDAQYSLCFLQTASEMVEPIYFEEKLLGVIDAESDEKNYFTAPRVAKVQELAQRVAPILLAPENASAEAVIRRNLRLLDWVEGARQLHPHLAHWIGLYVREDFIFPEKKSSDLLLGPFLGETTEHVRIPLSKGICGMALREERTINVDDVTSHPEHIACSLSTQSELVIPLRNKQGEFIAELDIDSNQRAAFNPKVQADFEAYAARFAEWL